MFNVIIYLAHQSKKHRAMINFNLLKIAIMVVLITTISSCNETDPETVIVEKTVVESVDSSAIRNDDPEKAEMENDILGLASKSEQEEKEIKELHKEIKALKTENDELKTRNNYQADVINVLATEKNPAISDDELNVRALVQSLNNAWGHIIGADDISELTNLFLPSYAVSMTSIGIDDKADVRMMTPNEFEDYANSIRKLKNTSLLVGNVNFVYFQGREGVYSIVYSAVLRIYKDDVATEDKSIISTVTVKQVDGQWKIGKYTWVSLGDEVR